MSDGTIDRLEDGAVWTLVMNRPERKNALSQTMYLELSEALAAASASDHVRVVVITGADGVFTAGNDLEDFANNPPEGANSPVYRFLKAVSTFDKPLIAAVDGPAIGIGTTMLLHCDFVVASERATFAMPFCKLGLVPEAGSSFLLPRILGQARAAELLLFGETLSAEKAEVWGLINRRVPHARLLEFTIDKAVELARQPPAAIRAAKELLRLSTKDELSEVIQVEATVFIERLHSPEAREALLAFKEKRQPNFEQFE